MGLFGGSTKKTQSSTTNTTKAVDRTTSPVVPDWIMEPVSAATGQLGELSKLDPSTLVAGSNPFFDQAGATVGGLSGSPWNFDAAADLTRGAATAPAFTGKAASLLDNLGAYMSPYTKDVVDTALADFDFGAGQTRAQQDLDLAASGAFGGSGAAITKSMTEDALTRGRASTSANLRDQAFTRGSALSGEDAGRRQQMSIHNSQQQEEAARRSLAGARQLADLSTQFDTNQRANAGAQFDLGKLMRQIDQEQRVAPLTLADYTGTQLAKLPLNLFAGEHTVGTETGTEFSTGKSKVSEDPSLLDKFGKVLNIGATIAGLFPSDERLKTDIVKLGVRPDGLGVYLYRYRWSPLRFIGVMAQEVLKVKPAAVVAHPSGFLMVDYGAL